VQPTLFHIIKNIVHSLDLGLAPAQIKLMKLLHHRQSTNSTCVNEMAKQLHVKAPSITTAVDELVEKGYVRRVQSKEDRRVVEMELTTKGEAIMKRAHEKVIKELAKKLEHVESKEYTAVHAAMVTLRKALQTSIDQ